jgi:hypothetical protein
MTAAGANGKGAYDLLGPEIRFSFDVRPRPGEVLEIYGVGFQSREFGDLGRHENPCGNYDRRGFCKSSVFRIHVRGRLSDQTLWSPIPEAAINLCGQLWLAT